jgi:hypothetical protein
MYSCLLLDFIPEATASEINVLFLQRINNDFIIIYAKAVASEFITPCSIQYWFPTGI